MKNHMMLLALVAGAYWLYCKQQKTTVTANALGTTLGSVWQTAPMNTNMNGAPLS